MDRRTTLLQVAARYARRFGDDEDMQQIAALAAIQAADSYRDGSRVSLKTYGSRRIWHRLIDETRRRDKLKSTHLLPDCSFLPDKPSDIYDGIDSVPEGLREPARMLAEGMSTERIVDQLGISPRTLRRIKRRIRLSLKGEE